MSGSWKRNINSTAIKVMRTWTRWGCAAVSRRGWEGAWWRADRLRSPTRYPANTPRVYLLHDNTGIVGNGFGSTDDTLCWMPPTSGNVQSVKISGVFAAEYLAFHRLIFSDALWIIMICRHRKTSRPLTERFVFLTFVTLRPQNEVLKGVRVLRSPDSCRILPEFPRTLGCMKTTFWMSLKRRQEGFGWRSIRWMLTSEQVWWDWTETPPPAASPWSILTHQHEHQAEPCRRSGAPHCIDIGQGVAFHIRSHSVWGEKGKKKKRETTVLLPVCEKQVLSGRSLSVLLCNYKHDHWCIKAFHSGHWVSHASVHRALAGGGSKVTVQWQTKRGKAVLRAPPSSWRPCPGLALWRCAWSPWSLPPVEATVRSRVTTGGHWWCFVFIIWQGSVSRFREINTRDPNTAKVGPGSHGCNPIS